MKTTELAEMTLRNIAKMDPEVMTRFTDMDVLLAIDSEDLEMTDDGEIVGFDEYFEKATVTKLDIDALVELTCNVFELSEDDAEELRTRLETAGYEELDDAVKGIVEYMDATGYFED